MKTPYKVLTATAIATTLVGTSLAGTTFAKIDKTLVKDNAGKVFVYDQGQLDDAYIDFKNGSSQLFSDFAQKTREFDIFAQHDDVTNTYTDYQDFANKFLQAKSSGTPFNAGDALATAPKATLPATVTEVSQNPDGSVKEEEKPVDQNQGEVKVDSVTAITTQMFKDQEAQLGFAINGGTTQADIAALEKAGYTIAYESTIAVTNGKVTPSADFEYKVVISKDGAKVAETALQKVKVISGTDAKKITKAILKNGDVVVNSAVVGIDGPEVKIEKYVQLNGTEQSGTVSGVAYKSSDSSKLVVTAQGKLIALAPGNVEIIISKAGMEDFKVAVTVKENAGNRTLKTVEGLENVSLSKGATAETKTFNIIAKDQYGDVANAAAIEAISSDAKVATVDQPAQTNNEGKTSFTVTAAGKGTATVTLKSGGKEVAKATVSVTEAGEVASYKLEAVDAQADTSLDLNSDLEKADNKVEYRFVGRDANGLLKEDFGPKLNDVYTVESSKIDVATVEVVGGKIVVTAQGVGTTTIAVKEGSLVRDSKVITVSNTTAPKVDINDADKDGVVTAADNFTVKVDDQDKKSVTLTSKVADTEKIGGAVIDFNMPVKVTSISVNNVPLSSDNLAQLIAKTGQNFVTSYVGKIEIPAITGKTVGELMTVGTNLKVTIENESGYQSTYTIALKKAGN